MKSRRSRRAMLKGAIAITAAPIAHAAPATTRATSSPAELTDAEHKLMAPGLDNLGKVLRHLRAQPIATDVDATPGFAVLASRPAGPSTLKLSSASLEYDGDVASLAFAPATRLSALLQAKRVTSQSLTRMYLDRLKTIGAQLRCVINLTEDRALAQAKRADAELAAGTSRGPLHGIPWGAKDLLATRDVPTTWGVKLYEHRVIDEDADAVQRLDAAGAVLVAKLSLGELAMDDVWFGGQTRNPWKPDEGSGGSSAGPGAAVAAGLVGFAIGSETLGSIVDPSVKCGVTGLRPTYDLVSRRGAMPLAPTMDKIGPMCRSVEDCALVLDAIKDPAVAFTCDETQPVKNLRVAVDAAAFARVKDLEQRKLYESTLDALKSLVGDLRPLRFPSLVPYVSLAWVTLLSESAASFADLLTTGQIRELKQQDEGSWPNLFRLGSTIPAADYLRAQRLRRQLQRDMAATMKDLDAYVTVPLSGPTLNVTNLAGYPSLTTRCGMLNGRPLSIEFIGNPYGESTILRLGHALSRSIVPDPTWPDTGAP